MKSYNELPMLLGPIAKALSERGLDAEPVRQNGLSALPYDGLKLSRGTISNVFSLNVAPKPASGLNALRAEWFGRAPLQYAVHVNDVDGGDHDFDLSSGKERKAFTDFIENQFDIVASAERGIISAARQPA